MNGGRNRNVCLQPLIVGNYETVVCVCVCVRLSFSAWIRFENDVIIICIRKSQIGFIYYLYALTSMKQWQVAH